MAVHSPFSKLFGRSPFSPVQEHIQVAQNCVSELVVFVEAVIQNNWDQAIETSENIYRLEDVADELKKNIRLNLPKSLFLPIPRADLLEMLRIQDKVANRAKDVTGIMVGRKMELPVELAGSLGFSEMYRTNSSSSS